MNVPASPHHDAAWLPEPDRGASGDPSAGPADPVADEHQPTSVSDGEDDEYEPV